MCEKTLQEVPRTIPCDYRRAWERSREKGMQVKEEWAQNTWYNKKCVCRQHVQKKIILDEEEEAS